MVIDTDLIKKNIEEGEVTAITRVAGVGEHSVQQTKQSDDNETCLLFSIKHSGMCVCVCVCVCGTLGKEMKRTQNSGLRNLKLEDNFETLKTYV